MNYLKKTSKVGELIFESYFLKDPDTLLLNTDRCLIKNFLKTSNHTILNKNLNQILKNKKIGDYIVANLKDQTCYIVELKTCKSLNNNCTLNQVRIIQNIPVIIIETITKKLFVVGRKEQYIYTTSLTRGQHDTSKATINMSTNRLTLYNFCQSISNNPSIIHSFCQQDYSKYFHVYQPKYIRFEADIIKANTNCFGNVTKIAPITKSIEAFQPNKKVITKPITKKLSVPNIPQSFNNDFLNDFKTRLNNIKKITDDCLNSMPSAYNYSKGS